MTTLDSLTTHYIICDTPSAVDLKILKNTSDVVVVRHTWLIECYRMKMAVDEEDFIVEIRKKESNNKGKDWNTSNHGKDKENSRLNSSQPCVIRVKDTNSATKSLFRDYVFLIKLFSAVEVKAMEKHIGLNGGTIINASQMGPGVTHLVPFNRYNPSKKHTGTRCRCLHNRILD